MENNNTYTNMQKKQYASGTSNHEEHNDNPDYWDILLSDLKDKNTWKDKTALDFACGKGRNVMNMLELCDWKRADGIDISDNNIQFCNSNYIGWPTEWYVNNGTDVSDLKTNEYDFIMSTIALQHIPVYDIRRSLLSDLLRTLKPGGLFSFQMGYGEGLDDPLGANRPRSSYFENIWEATATNSEHDVRIQSEKEVTDDLLDIGYVDVSTVIKEAYSDSGHTHWIYVKCYKEKN